MRTEASKATKTSKATEASKETKTSKSTKTSKAWKASFMAVFSYAHRRHKADRRKEENRIRENFLKSVRKNIIKTLSYESNSIIMMRPLYRCRKAYMKYMKIYMKRILNLVRDRKRRANSIAL